MDLTFTSLPQRVPRLRPIWPDLLAWLICGSAVIHTGLLVAFSDLHNLHGASINWLYPLGMSGAAIIMGVAAYLHTSRATRWAWSLQTGSLLCGLLRTGLTLEAQRSGSVVPESVGNTLYILMYLFAIAGVALYLPTHIWWHGTTWRVLIDSALVGVAALVLLHSTLPLLIQPWAPAYNQVLLFPAFNLAAIFAFGAVSLRYGPQGGPLLVFAVASMICLLCGDTLAAVTRLFPIPRRSMFTVAPLYTLHYVLLALGAYRSVWKPPRAPAASRDTMPLTHWILWALVPRVLLLAALIATLMLVLAPRPVVLTLLVLAGVREMLAAADHRRVLRALHSAQQQAHQAATQTQDFLARIIHDVAAPLQGLHAITDTIPRSTTPLALVGPLHGQLSHLDHLIDQLRSYLQSRSASLTITAVDVAPICAAAVYAAQQRTDAQAIHLRIVFAVDRAVICGDAVALRRILDNLLANAIAVTPPGDEVVLHVSAEDREAIIVAVTDTGMGIPPAQQARIFEPLVRFRSGAGLGLGLAIVRELTYAMGGTCGVRSEVGVGSTFWVRLRCARDRCEEEDDYADRGRDR